MFYSPDAIPETDSGWTAAGITTRATTDITGLAIGSRYYFRFSAVTPDITTDFCPPVAKIVV
jgi:hypothetical protein